MANGFFAIRFGPAVFSVLYAKAMATRRETYGAERGAQNDVWTIWEGIDRYEHHTDQRRNSATGSDR